jgi:serine/threonine-protein kinase
VISAEVGAQFGQYRIEEFIGRGGMGIVYRAEHSHLGRKVALKLLAPELAENASFRERFVRESRLAASIDHPNVIPIYEASEVDGHYFIAMRYVDGVDLKQVIRGEGAMSIERTVAYMQQLAGALDAAHTKGLVHRDVKPGNVLVATGSDHCYLTDFGLTKAMSSSTTGFTATGQFVGTTDYCAPEQIEGKPIDRRTDVYSLACVFYECLTGHPPFHRETDMATMWAHIQEPPPSAARERSDVPESLDGVLATAMAKSKDERYPTCSSFTAAAMAALETATGRSFADSSTQPTPPRAGPHVPGASPMTTPIVVSDSFTRPEDFPPPVAPPPPPVQHGYGAYNGAPPPQFPPPAGAWAPGPYDSQPTAVKRNKPVTAIALIVAALLIAGGGTVAALIVTKNKDSNQENASAQQPAPDREPPAESQPPETTPRETTPEPEPAPAEPEPELERESAPPEDPPATESGGADVAAAAQAHWDAIGAGSYGEAFSYFSASNPQNRSRWISEHRKDGITSVVAEWETGEVNGDTATAIPVVLETESDRGGCQSWTGSYDMVKEGGEWKIADSHLSASDCG